MENQSRTQASFLLSVNVVFFSQVAIYGLAFLFRVVLARGLGDVGLGAYSLFYLSVLIASGTGSLGIGLGSIYFLNKGDYSLQQLFSSSVFAIGVGAAVTSLVVALYAMAFGDEAFVAGRAYWLYLPTVPVMVTYVLLTALLHGSSRFPALAFVGVTQGVAALLIAGGLYLTDNLDLFGAILAWSGSFAVADVLALTLVGAGNIHWREVLRPRWDILRRQIGYGAQGQVSNIAQLLNFRFDQYLVAAFVARASVGHYAVAVGVGETVWWVSTAVAIVMLPRLTGLDKERADEVTPIVSRNTLLISALAGAAVVIVSPVAIPLVFGDEFKPAVTPLILLMPGLVAISGSRVLASYLFSQGKVIYNTYTTLLTLVATLALDLALIPTLEVKGAAIASSVAYVLALVSTIWFYRRLVHIRLKDLLLAQPADIAHYRNLVRRIVSHWGSRPQESM